MDFKKYPEWNPFIKSISGEQKVGSHLKVNLQGMTFKPEILVLEKNREFKWVGKLWIKGLFDGTHQFALEESGDGTISFIHGESFSGILVPLFKKKLETETNFAFQKMNKALKNRAESMK